MVPRFGGSMVLGSHGIGLSKPEGGKHGFSVSCV